MGSFNYEAYERHQQWLANQQAIRERAAKQAKK